MIQVCIMDMDGTLMDSMPHWRDAERAAFAAWGVPLPAGPSTRLHMLHDMAGTLSALNRDGEAVWAAYAAHMHRAYAEEILPKPGARLFLEKLGIRSIPCWMATGSRREHAEAALIRCGLRSHFQGIYSTKELALPKEDPAFFTWLGGEIGVVPAEMLVVEDSPHVARSAKAAGCMVFGVGDSIYDDSAPMRALCDRYADDLMTLASFL